MVNEESNRFMQMAVELSRKGSESIKGGPFGAVVVKDGVVIGEGYNSVLILNDPTAHAEVMAIRDACNHLDSFCLEGCVIYSTCEPCPMCLGAIYWARPSRVYYASTRFDAATAGFDDAFIYSEVAREPGKRTIPMIFMTCPEVHEVFKAWIKNPDKVSY